MSNQPELDVMNRLLAVVYRSLPMYLHEASPWTSQADDKALAALHRIVADQQQQAGRIAEYVLDQGGMPETGDYPMEFTDLHFLSLDWLVNALVEAQQRDLAAIEGLLPWLRNSPAATELAAETLGMTKAHLEQMRELQAAQPVRA